MMRHLRERLLTTGLIVSTPFCFLPYASASTVGTPNTLSDYTLSADVGFNTESTHVDYTSPNVVIPVGFLVRGRHGHGGWSGRLCLHGGFNPTACQAERSYWRQSALTRT